MDHENFYPMQRLEDILKKLDEISKDVVDLKINRETISASLNKVKEDVEELNEKVKEHDKTLRTQENVVEDFKNELDEKKKTKWAIKEKIIAFAVTTITGAIGAALVLYLTTFVKR